jgi:hypothetical protein
MRRTTITCLSAVLSCTAAMAQTRLQGGENPYPVVVKQPYFYYDLMRTEHNAWIRQYRPDEQQAWGNSNLLINRKDADGHFQYLEYSLWDWNAGNWVVYNKYQYEREKTNGKLSTYKASSYFRDQSTQQVRNYLIEDHYEYTNDLISSVNSTYSNSDGAVLVNVDYTFFYDGQGKRLQDSQLVNLGAYYYNTFYTYNGPGGQCSEQCMLMNRDTVSINYYNYDNSNRLSRFAEFSYLNQVPASSYEVLFTYDTQGNTSEVTLSFGDSTNLSPVAFYKHGYNNLNKLQWMTYYSYENNQWMKEDSVYITYTGTKADTSYGYMSANGTDWNTYPNFRFLFDENRVGIKNAENNHLSFSLYPNPAREQVTINLDENKPVKRILVTDLLGRQVASYSDINTPINISDLTKGIYLVRVETNDAVGVKKLVVE